MDQDQGSLACGKRGCADDGARDLRESVLSQGMERGIQDLLAIRDDREGKIVNGEVVELKVTPEERAKGVVIVSRKKRRNYRWR